MECLNIVIQHWFCSEITLDSDSSGINAIKGNYKLRGGDDDDDDGSDDVVVMMMENGIEWK